ncbi:hypothetical protein ACFQS1_24060 [Paractinoplanes rhizophilus]|uniref:Saccharopine dehydrogenase NADP binding domain-containing protein n=1 Tax=Paractinoplanes rhizophilus TaxID=1416877 RepID=A0ABW2HXZ2_9ACTN
MNEIWVLGAAGRTGSAIAERLKGEDLVLVGRDRARLAEVAAATGGRPVATGDIRATLAAAMPKVVVNTIGRPLPDGGHHYLDLANDVTTIGDVLSRDAAAKNAGRTLVTGAGFGVLAAESAVLRLCAGRPRPSHVRVDGLAMIEPVPGKVGEALAGTLVDALAAGGRRYAGGRLVRTRLGGHHAKLTLPGGATAATVAVPTGDLIAAQRASGAPSVIAATSELPSGLAARVLLPPVSALLSIPAVARFAKRRLAGLDAPATPPARDRSWARAQGTWPGGTTREVWLEAPEGMTFTTAVAAEVARRLAHDEGRPGAYTPGALFGAALAEAAGGRFIE